MANNDNSRRDFLRVAAGSTLVSTLAPSALSAAETQSVSPNDVIRLATIGMGGMGFGDTRTALEVPGVEFVAAADCYEGRLARAKEDFGKEGDDDQGLLERSWAARTSTR